jgi:AcrR family transcriptional regulator
MTNISKPTGRADARLNRDRLLDAARAALAANPDASLNSIAKLADVGPGTLYRHFPTREALILAVYKHDIAQHAAAVPDLLAEHPPLTAFRVWLEQLAAYIRVKHGLGDALNSAAAQTVINETYEPVTNAVAELLSACAKARQLRPDLNPSDVLLLMGFLWRVSEDEPGRAQGQRIFKMTVDGMRPRGTRTSASG